jgi:asparagine synthase (glutamine-hydrolysing)
MCGIVAIWAPRGGVAPGDLGAIEELRHRGPDAATRWVSPCGRVGLAQARLAVVGVDNGAQPVRAGSEVSAVVNGELYGYRRQREELIARGHRFTTESDSEVVVHLYEDDPDGFVHHLRGEFAVVLWDARRQRMLVVRDRFGIKPLFYTWIGRRLVIASEAKALFEAGAARNWDVESFHDYLHGCFAPDRSLFAGIYQVPPGGILRADPGGVTVSTYWDLDYPTIDDAPDEPTEAEIRERVTEAVRLRLVADVPVGFHLSGGLDSSVVVGAAAGHAPLRTFTVCFPGNPLDEGPVAARTAIRLGADHHEVVDPGEDARLAEQTIVFGEMLQENHHGTARLAQARAIAADGLRVALAGEGGDELFGGYGHHQADARLSESPQRLAKAAEQAARLLDGADQPTLSGTLDRLGFIPSWLVERCMNTSLPVRPLLHHDVRSVYGRRDSMADLIDRSDGQLKGRAPVHQSLYLFLRTWFCNYILAAERLDMARSVEVRLPLLDHHLFEAARRLSPASLAGSPTKRILRDAMREHLTDEVHQGVKRPFFAPTADGATAVARLRQRVDHGALTGNRLLDRRAVEDFLRRVEATPGPVTPVTDRMLHLVESVAILQQTYRLES